MSRYHQKGDRLLALLALTFFVLSFILTLGWKSPMWMEGPPMTERYTKVIVTIRKICHRLSFYTTIVAFFFTLVMWSDGWSGVFGVVAALSSIGMTYYLRLCYKKKVSPWDAKPVHDKKWVNILLLDGAFQYFYAFTWIQLMLIFISYLQ